MKLEIFLMAMTSFLTNVQGYAATTLKFGTETPVTWKLTKMRGFLHAKNIHVQLAFWRDDPCDLLVYYLGVEALDGWKEVERCRQNFNATWDVISNICSVTNDDTENRVLVINEVFKSIRNKDSKYLVGIASNGVFSLTKGAMKWETNSTTELQRALKTSYAKAKSASDSYTERLESYLTNDPQRVVGFVDFQVSNTPIKHHLELGLNDTLQFWNKTSEVWKQGRFCVDFFQYFKTPIDCGSDCAYHDGILRSCKYDSNLKTLSVEATLLAVNPNDIILEADAFQLERKINGQHCVIDYIGPKYVAVKGGGCCLHMLTNIQLISNDSVTLSHLTCPALLERPKFEEIASINCSHNTDHVPIQVKKTSRETLAYCPGRNVSLPGSVLKCDDQFPMIIPKQIPFSVEQSYTYFPDNNNELIDDLKDLEYEMGRIVGGQLQLKHVYAAEAENNALAQNTLMILSGFSGTYVSMPISFVIIVGCVALSLIIFAWALAIWAFKRNIVNFWCKRRPW